MPTLWWPFAFLATVGLPLLFGWADVLVHVFRALVDTIVGQSLEPG